MFSLHAHSSLYLFVMGVTSVLVYNYIFDDDESESGVERK